MNGWAVLIFVIAAFALGWYCGRVPRWTEQQRREREALAKGLASLLDSEDNEDVR